MKFIKNLFKGEELEDECSICLQKIYSKEVKILRCNHKLHRKCYEKLLESNCQNKCPLCREDFNQNWNTPLPISNSSERLTLENILNEIGSGVCCSICNNVLDLNEENCTVVKSNSCGCFYHFGCLKDKRRLSLMGNCSCGKDVDFRDVDMLSYLYFLNGYKSIVGEIKQCKCENCNTEGNPKRWGYCSYHNSSITTNIAFALSLQLMTRYVLEDDVKRRMDIFYRILSKLNEWQVGRGENVANLKIRLGL